MYSFTQLEEIKSRIVTQLAAQQNQIESAKGSFAAAEATLTGMQSTYGDWATDVNTLATANPNDAAVQSLKAFRDRLIAEFTSTKNTATALKNAVNEV